MRKLVAAAAATLAVAGTLSAVGASDPPLVDRSVEPVVLKGVQFPAWSAGPEVSAREPGVPTNYEVFDSHQYLPDALRSDCYDAGSSEEFKNDHNCYQSSRVPQGVAAVRTGAPVANLRALAWDGTAFVEIPFQVDEMFTRYLSNNASGFSFYSTVDQHTTYAFDREGFRFTDNEPDDACQPSARVDPHAEERIAAAPDPIQGLDDNDELVFMYSDSGAHAPASASFPDWASEAHEVAVADPTDPGALRFVYVVRDGGTGPPPTFEPYVRYERDPSVGTEGGRLGADLFVYSQSSYEGYGAAPKGPYCDALTGAVVTNLDNTAKIGQRRPLDTAWVKTPRYHFRYDGRWLMTQIRVSPNDSGLEATPSIGPDLIDQFKARAFQQRPGGQTPCCGYEEEVNNWGGSSILLGEKAGPVRAIRETWGADSSTNNVRREVFYRDVIEWGDYLRVHPVPPLDGAYVQWDYNADAVTTYRNPQHPEGVLIDGQNDEVFGNFYVKAARDEVRVRSDDETPVTGPQDVGVPLGGEYESCRIASELPDPDAPFVGRPKSICNDIDLPDPKHSGVSTSTQWEQVDGPDGSIVSRWWVRQVTPGGAAQSVVAVPYYRDDSCFDDGTGSNPGPHLHSRDPDDGPYASWTDPDTGHVHPRECWAPGDELTGDPARDARYWQGSIGTQGMHIVFIAESDNAGTTVPTTEIHTLQRMVILHSQTSSVGERYGRWVEFALVTATRPFAA